MKKDFQIKQKSNSKTNEKKLIREDYNASFSTKSLLESDKRTGEKRWHLEGIGAQANIKNGNGRVYPSEILDPAFEKYQYVIENKLPGCIGEMSHPSGNGERSDSDINFDWASHMITKVWKEKASDDNFLTKSKILKNPIGLNYIVPLLEEGITLAFSTRGFGESMFSESEEAEIVQNYELLTIDIVATPSAPDAYQKGMLETAKKFKSIMTESQKQKIINPKAKKVSLYYETLELFQKLGKEDVFIETMEEYAWDYSSFYKDFSSLSTMLIKGAK
jgi:hypothetical protein